MWKTENADMQNLEMAIYLPMLLIILEKDYRYIENGGFKLKEPYKALIGHARQHIMEDFKKTKAYLKEHQLKVIRNSVDELFTEYHFYYQQHVEVRRYSNIRLRNQCVELLKKYLNNDHALENL